MPDQQFIHLHLHSAYSLAEGAIKIPDLIQNVNHLRQAAVAVTDTNNMFGAFGICNGRTKDRYSTDNRMSNSFGSRGARACLIGTK